ALAPALAARPGAESASLRPGHRASQQLEGGTRAFLRRHSAAQRLRWRIALWTDQSPLPVRRARNAQPLRSALRAAGHRAARAAAAAAAARRRRAGCRDARPLWAGRTL